MLNRRYLRIKVFQQLYTFFISESADQNRTEMQLFISLEKIYDLYLSLLYLLVEINNAARQHIELSRVKHLPTSEDLNPNLRFIENRIITLIANNIRFKKHIETKKISWNDDNEFPSKIYRLIRQSPEFQEYMSATESNFEKDKAFIIDIYKKFIFNSEQLHGYFEDRNIHWEDDITLANLSAVKTLEKLKEGTSTEENILLPLFKDEAEDTDFARNLFRKTIRYENEFGAMISAKATNWELERIAVADMILMKMALCELLHFDNIPVKVTLNEYIEISKDYSTPQSKTFINGILDKIVVELKTSEKIVKKGRGLME